MEPKREATTVRPGGRGRPAPEAPAGPESVNPGAPGGGEGDARPSDGSPEEGKGGE